MICSRCGENESRPTHRWCGPCNASYQRARRRGAAGDRMREVDRARDRSAHNAKTNQRRKNETYRAEQRAATRSRLEQKHRERAKVASCIICGVEWCPTFGRHSSATKTCGEDCGRVLHLRRKVRKEKVRKHRKRGVAVVEIVDLITVLERDKWRCQICGVDTPRALRSTYEPNAPEVDHIIPLALGGEHTYRNCQCACRDCNMAKGARIAA